MSLAAGVSLKAILDVPEDLDERNPKVRLEVRRDQAVVFHSTLLRGAGGRYSTVLGLRPGQYELRAWREGSDDVVTESAVVEELPTFDGLREWAMAVR